MFGHSSSSRMKQVTDPLDDRVKARIVGRDLDEFGYISSGTDHSVEDDVSSSSFSEISFDFPECNAGDFPPENDSGYECEVPICNADDAIEDDIEPIIRCHVDWFQNVLASRVSEALELLSCLSLNKSNLRRHVVAYLRDIGYNAAICETKWERNSGITAGNHQFMDVLQSDFKNVVFTRYIIDLEFSAEFEIARPTNQFELMIQSLPEVFVGRSEELKKIVKVMCEAARRSLRSRGLHLPPWRKHRFMQNKWLGSCKRTTNFRPPLEKVLAVKCRSVGFNAAANGRLLFPVVNRTR